MDNYEIVKSTLVGRTMMVLSMLKNVSDKKVFIEKVFKGLTANSSHEVKAKILSNIF